MLVATANCQHWRPTGFLATALARLGADVLGLQEVDRLAVRTRFAQQTGAAARASGSGHSWAWARAERMGPGGVWGQLGVGLVVRGGIADNERLDIPRLPPPVGERVRPLTGRRKRVALLARALPVDGPEVTVAVAHLAVSRPEAVAQLAAVVTALLERPGPHLLLADLNIPVQQADLGPLEAASASPTFPRSAPHSLIDVVAAAGLALAPADVVDLGCSDHLAMTAEVLRPSA
jgi:endonuclease/exonuclease/phosphatase family metal-dependent hydrolase